MPADGRALTLGAIGVLAVAGATDRGWVYDQTFTRLTSSWYREVLRRLPDGANLLDVGVATAGPLVVNADLVRRKRIRVTGVDIDPEYLRRAHRRIEEAGLARQVRLVRQPIEEHGGGPYDAVYFACSFMLLDDPEAVARHVLSLLNPGGRIFWTQTFQLRTGAFSEWVKPKLKELTTIDFGSVTYPEDFLAVLRGAGVSVLSEAELGRWGRQSFRMVVGAFT